MKPIGIILLLLLASVGFVRSDANGGTDCAACTLLIGLAEQLSQVHSTDIVTAVEQFLCPNFPEPFNTACMSLIERYGSVIIDGIYNKATPDIICHDIGFCTQDAGSEFCHLFPLPSNLNSKIFVSRKGVKANTKDISDNPICLLPGVSEICAIIDSFSNDHLPIQDADRDKFSTHSTLRGTQWRGKDCNDGRKDVYPGRKPLNHDTKFDSNCNGIYGSDPSSGMSHEEMFCAGSNQRGIAILGDSAGAHFHIPPEYFMVESYTKGTFEDILMILENEFDWPQLSSVTAFTANQWPHSIHGPVESLYGKIRNDNRCIHRDYQNIGVNGADSSNMHNIMHGLSRNRTTDNPLIVVLALIGNDVCNGHPDTVAHMTTVTEYKSNMMTTLNYLNSTLPRESKVIISGLADGRVLWNTMSERLHPIGQLNSDVRYKDLYAYLNCLQVSPCTGWMSSNQTLRNLTSQRAANLSAQAKDIVATQKFQQFELVYIDYDIQKIMDDWRSRGGQDWEVIEPVDGFHPSQAGQALSAEYMYDLLVSKFPDVVGKVNPNNQKIAEMFGDQGGY